MVVLKAKFLSLAALEFHLIDTISHDANQIYLPF